jgi:hypothetical protein
MKKTWIAALFKKFELIWGEKWTRGYGDEKHMQAMMNEWQGGLANLSGTDVEYALTKLRATAEWPPTIASFIEASKLEKPQDVPGGLGYKRLPTPKVNPKTPERELAKMRELLR